MYDFTLFHFNALIVLIRKTLFNSIPFQSLSPAWPELFSSVLKTGKYDNTWSQRKADVTIIRALEIISHLVRYSVILCKPLRQSPLWMSKQYFTYISGMTSLGKNKS